MTDVGLSYLGALGLKEESVFGTPETVDDWAPFLSESLNENAQNQNVESIHGDAELLDIVPGLIQAGGGITLYPWGGTAFGKLLWLASRATTPASLPYSIAASPTLSITSGTGLTGTYLYKVARIMREIQTQRLYLTNPSPVSAAQAATNQIIRVSWTNPSASDLSNYFPGFEAFGTLIYRSTSLGAEGTIRALDIVTSAGATTYDDDGSEALGTAVVPTPLYYHAFDTGTGQPKSATVEKIMNNGYSEIYAGCMVNQFQISAKPSDVIQAQFDLFAQRMISQAEGTPVMTYGLPPMPGHSLISYLSDQGGSGTVASLLESWDFSLNNNLERVYRGTGQRYLDEITAGPRAITGSIDLSHKNTDALDDFQAGQVKSLLVTLKAHSTTTPAATFTKGGNTVRSMPFMLAVHTPAIVYSSHAAALNGKNRVVGKYPWVAKRDSTYQYAARVAFLSTASSYAVGGTVS